MQPFLSKVEFDTSADGLFDHMLDHDVSKTLVFRRYYQWSAALRKNSRRRAATS
jgi:hypothetical protein